MPWIRHYIILCSYFIIALRNDLIQRRPPGRPPTRWRDQIQGDLGKYLFRRLNTRPKEGLNGEGWLVGERRDTPSYALKSSQVSQLLFGRNVCKKTTMKHKTWEDLDSIHVVFYSTSIPFYFKVWILTGAQIVIQWMVPYSNYWSLRILKWDSFLPCYKYIFCSRVFLFKWLTKVTIISNNSPCTTLCK